MPPREKTDYVPLRPSSPDEGDPELLLDASRNPSRAAGNLGAHASPGQCGQRWRRGLWLAGIALLVTAVVGYRGKDKVVELAAPLIGQSITDNASSPAEADSANATGLRPDGSPAHTVTAPGPPPRPSPSSALGPAPPLGDEKYLLILEIREQESRSSLHLHQMILLSRALNRTLILPQVGHGRIGQCYGLDFAEWYDPQALDKWGARTISQTRFLERLEGSGSERKDTEVQVARLTYKETELNGGTWDPELRGLKVEPDAHPGHALASGERYCLVASAASPRSPLTDKLLFLDSRTTLKLLGPHSAHSKFKFGWNVLRYLQDQTASAPILGVHWELRYEPFSTLEQADMIPPLPFPMPDFDSVRHFDYSAELIGTADRMLSALDGAEKVVLVHWRTETVEPDNLPQCGASLVATLSRLIDSGGYTHLWLASDYPFEDVLRPSHDASPSDSTYPDGSAKPLAHSGTFRPTEAHHSAMRGFLDALRASVAAPVTSLPLLGPQLSPPLDVGGMDPGTAGVLVKLVASRAGYFLAGRHAGAGACARDSSYTSAIVSMRKEAMEKGGQAVKNEVQYWRR